MASKLKKKMRQGKRKEREGEKAKSESRKSCATNSAYHMNRNKE